jgi:acyl-CoA reductase-like NAD-dependent aldehyde dehydrogenase
MTLIYVSYHPYGFGMKIASSIIALVNHMAYGGVKESGVGREGLKYPVEEMTEMKLVCIKK